MTDRYDQEVDRLTAHPELIVELWADAEPLFGFCSPERDGYLYKGKGWGCLILVARGDNVAYTDELTEDIRADGRIPRTPEKITPAHLPVFAEWQRRIDKTLGRTPPPLI